MKTRLAVTLTAFTCFSYFNSDLNRTVDCITSKIGRWCGPEAAQLIPILVKPMVRKSTKCDVKPLSGLGTALMTTLRRRPYRQVHISIYRTKCL